MATKSRRQNEFSRATQKAALARQKDRCALCGETITALGHDGQATHAFGEGVHAHHIRHVKQGGTNTAENCVILCWSCHYTVHEGGSYRHSQVETYPEDYPHYNG
jgi:5-methylcytosine-specific restriction endonuclease McrA